MIARLEVEQFVDIMGSAKKNIKATKKFEKKHLKGVIEKRRETAKIKQRQQLKAKKQAKRAIDAKSKSQIEGESQNGSAKVDGKKGQNVKSVSVDEFFKENYHILNKKIKEAQRAKLKLGKRKREETERADASDSDDDDDFYGEDPVAASGSEDEGLGGVLDEDNIGMSKKAMEDLAEKDPEFYKYLQENDPEALEFDENADLAEVDELSEGEEQDEEPKKKKQKKDKKSKKAGDEEHEDVNGEKELTREMIAKWKKQMDETHSLRAARQVVLAFRTAAHLNEDEDESKARYTISSPEVFHDTLVVGLKSIPTVLQHHIPTKETASGKVHVPTDSKKFKALSVLMRSYVTSILHLLSTLSDDGTLKLTISALDPLVPYLMSFRKLLKSVVKSVVNLWSQASSSESTRITAFLVMRRIVVVGDKGVRETVLKSAYQGIVQGTRVNNANTIKGINLMKNSAVELWGLDEGVAYTTAFTAIRQLAIHLRNCIINNKNESYKTIYNWQYVHSLDFWSCVLAEHCSTIKLAEAGKSADQNELNLLIYPLVQVTLGAMKLIPKSAYFPLQFHLVRSLLRITRATGVYIPLAMPLLEVLASAEMRSTPKKTRQASTAKSLPPLDFALNYRAPDQYLRTRTYQEGVGDQVTELLGEYLALWSKNIAFPEFSLPIVISLKRWIKQARRKAPGGKGSQGNPKVISQLAVLAQKIEANGRFVEERRAKVDFAPRDRAQVDAFLADLDWQRTPLGAYVAAQRVVRAEKARVLAEERAAADGERRRLEKGGEAAGKDKGKVNGKGKGKKAVDVEEDDEEPSDDEGTEMDDSESDSESGGAALEMESEDEGMEFEYEDEDEDE